MTIDEAIEVLELHNKWRKGADIEMQSPVKIGMAIDLVICELKTLRERQSSLFFDKPDVSSKDEWISREVIEYDWDNEGFGDESIKRLLNKGYEKGYSDALNKNIKKTIQKNTIMELYEIEVITEPIYFRKMRVESGYLYNFYDCKEERYQKEWIFVPDVTQQIIIGKTEKLPYDTIMPL